MNKEELKNKLEEIANKSKEVSLKVFFAIKQKAKAVFTDFQERRQKAKLAKAEKETSSKNIGIYDKQDRELKPNTSSFTIKPMSFSGQKVSVKKSFFSKVKSFSINPKNCFSKFTINFLFLGSAFVSAWLLGLSFGIEAKAFCAFLALFLVGLTIRYIKTSQGSLCYGLLFGFFANLFIFSWIFDTILGGTGNFLLAMLSLVGLALILATPYILFALFAWQYKHKLLLFPFASACAWVALEVLAQLVAYKWIGFPWFVLGYTQYANLELIQISALLGAYGVSFFIVFCSFGLSVILGKDIQLKDRVSTLLFVVILSLLFFGYGKKQLFEISQRENKIVKVAIVQPNTHKDMIEGNLQQVSQTLSNIALVLQSYPDIDLVVWPESTLPDYLEEGSLKDFMAQISSNTKAYQIAGGTSVSKQENNNKEGAAEEIKEFVAAGLYHQGNLTDKHYKRQLVPFGEFLPLQEYLKEVYDVNNISSLTGSFVKGSGPAKILVLEGEKETSFGAQICFESIFPILWRLEVLGGAEFFVNLSNDGWFLKTAAPYQHLRLNVFRAVENNRPIVRSANSGLSAYINNSGKIEYHTNLDEQALEIIDLSLPLNPEQTFYTIYGDIFGFLCLFLTLVFSYNCLGLSQEND